MKLVTVARGFAADVRRIRLEREVAREKAWQASQLLRNRPAQILGLLAGTGKERSSTPFGPLRQQVAIMALTAVLVTRLNLMDMADDLNSSDEPTVAELVTKLSEQSSNLIRDELRLAQTELTEKIKRAGLGLGYLGGAGLLGFFAVAGAVTAAILLLARVVPAWLSALIVSGALSTAAAAAALTGKKEVAAATPMVPTRTVESLKDDVEEVKEHGHR